MPASRYEPHFNFRVRRSALEPEDYLPATLRCRITVEDGEPVRFLLQRGA